MRVPDLLSAFLSLPQQDMSPAVEDQFVARPIPAYPAHRIARDREGRPSVLLSVSDVDVSHRPMALSLENLTVQHEVDCQILRADGPDEIGRFTILRCSTDNEMLHAYFLRVAGSLVGTLGPGPTTDRISHAVDVLAELFRSISQPPRRSTQGIWAELLLIARSTCPGKALQAWHLDPSDRYDFSDGDQRLEVKSFSTRLRQHHFSLDQLDPPQGCTLLVASVATERAGGGASLNDLCHEIRDSIGEDPEVLLRLDRTLGLSLGQSLPAALDDRFDRERAEESILFFEREAVPRMCPDLPVGVSDVRFRSDLTGRPSADLRAYREHGGLFAVLLL